MREEKRKIGCVESVKNVKGKVGTTNPIEMNAETCASASRR
jgi:hypothetical protein